MIINLTKNTLVSAETCHAMGLFGRARGMIGRDFSHFDAMVFDRCSAVHTFFMSFPLDIVFTGRDNVVLKTFAMVRPWRLCVSSPGAFFAVELPGGTIERSRTQSGDKLDLYAGLTTETIRKIGMFLFDNKTGKAGVNPAFRRGEK